MFSILLKNSKNPFLGGMNPTFPIIGSIMMAAIESLFSLIILSASTMLFTLRVEEHARCLVQEMKEKWIVRNYYLVTFFVAFTTTFLLTFFIREHGTGWHAIIGWCINFSAVATEMMFFSIASHVILDLLVDKFAIFLLKRKKRN